jgi:hypothetical protein
VQFRLLVVIVIIITVMQIARGSISHQNSLLLYSFPEGEGKKERKMYVRTPVRFASFVITLRRMA